jgi:hypothetical protein
VLCEKAVNDVWVSGGDNGAFTSPVTTACEHRPPVPPRVPSPRVVFALALAVFATGFALGAAAGPSAPSSYAANGAGPSTIVVVLPAPAPLAAPVTTAAPVTPAPAVTTSSSPAADTPAPVVTTQPAATTTTTSTGTTPSDTTPTDTTPTATTPGLPAVKHVWLIVLAQHGLQDGFGPDSHSVLLRQTLPPKGVLLLNHYAVAHGSLANGLALLTGRAPTDATRADCPVYQESCLVPADQKALTDQLTGAGLTWKAYVEDIGNGGPATPGSCRHPALGAPDPWQLPQPGDAALTPRDPFVYVHSIVDAPECSTGVVGTTQLTADLETAGKTPSFSYIVPNACHDGRDTPCAPGALPGTAASDGWLRDVLRQIRSAPAYKRDGLIVITFDQGPAGDTSSRAGGTVAGGGKVGALLLSHFLAPGTTVDTPTDHVSLLKTIEDLFGLGHLGLAAADDVPALTPAQLTKSSN